AHDLELEGRGEAGDEGVGIEPELGLEHLDQPPPRGRRGGARLLDLARADRLGVDRAHCRLPASSKIGMYMRTTIAPITRPIAAIRSGSNSRVNQSTQREISSSWNSAIPSIISPMLPPFSPTPRMRLALVPLPPLVFLHP